MENSAVCAMGNDQLGRVDRLMAAVNAKYNNLKRRQQAEQDRAMQLSSASNAGDEQSAPGGHEPRNPPQQRPCDSEKMSTILRNGGSASLNSGQRSCNSTRRSCGEASCQSLTSMSTTKPRTYWVERELFVAAEDLCLFLNGGVDYRRIALKYQRALELLLEMARVECHLVREVDVYPMDLIPRVVQLLSSLYRESRALVGRSGFPLPPLPDPRALGGIADHRGATDGARRALAAGNGTPASGAAAMPTLKGVQNPESPAEGRRGNHPGVSWSSTDHDNRGDSAQPHNILTAEGYLKPASSVGPRDENGLGYPDDCSDFDGVNETFVPLSTVSQAGDDMMDQVLAFRIAVARLTEEKKAHEDEIQKLKSQVAALQLSVAHKEKEVKEVRAAAEKAKKSRRKSSTSDPPRHAQELSGSLSPRANEAHHGLSLQYSPTARTNSGGHMSTTLSEMRSAAGETNTPRSAASASFATKWVNLVSGGGQANELSSGVHGRSQINSAYGSAANSEQGDGVALSESMNLCSGKGWPAVGPGKNRYMLLDLLYSECYRWHGMELLWHALNVVFKCEYDNDAELSVDQAFLRFKADFNCRVYAALASHETFTFASSNITPLRNEYIATCNSARVKPNKDVVKILSLVEERDVQSLSLPGAGLTDSDLPPLLSILPRLHRLRFVDLSHNDIRNGGVAQLCYSVLHHPTIEFLSLSNNHNINDDGGQALLQLVTAMPQLRGLHVTGTDIQIPLRDQITFVVQRNRDSMQTQHDGDTTPLRADGAHVPYAVPVTAATHPPVSLPLRRPENVCERQGSLTRSGGCTPVAPVPQVDHATYESRDGTPQTEMAKKVFSSQPRPHQRNGAELKRLSPYNVIHKSAVMSHVQNPQGAPSLGRDSPGMVPSTGTGPHYAGDRVRGSEGPGESDVISSSGPLFSRMTGAGLLLNPVYTASSAAGHAYWTPSPTWAGTVSPGSTARGKSAPQTLAGAARTPLQGHPVERGAASVLVSYEKPSLHVNALEIDPGATGVTERNTPDGHAHSPGSVAPMLPQLQLTTPSTSGGGSTIGFPSTLHSSMKYPSSTPAAKTVAGTSVRAPKAQSGSQSGSLRTHTPRGTNSGSGGLPSLAPRRPTSGGVNRPASSSLRQTGAPVASSTTSNHSRVLLSESTLDEHCNTRPAK